MTVVLASASPRRQELLSTLGVDFRVLPSGLAERDPFPGERPEVYARSLAREKAENVAARFPDDVVLAADTVVALRGYILEKPVDGADARRMLRLLSGETHLVVTAVAVRCGRHEHMDAGRAQVTMRAFSDADAQAYISTGEPMDKAGAYAVQGKGSKLVTSVAGCYNAVVGLPVCVAVELLRRCGVDVLPAECRHGTDKARWAER